MTKPISYKFVIPADWNPKLEIERLPCISETPAFAVLEFNWHFGKDHNRVRKADRVFDTWAEAHTALLARANDRLVAARRELQLAQGYHGNVVGMKEPVDA